MDRVPPTGKSPCKRVVLLGASNVARSISTIVETSALVLGRPLEVHAALGHGRSYGMYTRFLARGIGGIIDSGLWSALGERPAAPTAALVTDIGNDLLYDVPVPQIATWVRTCLDRLAALEASVVITRLPIDNLRQLGEARFRLLRTAFFPGCTLSLAVVAGRARELDERLQAMATERGMQVVQHDPAWYGFDPIHIRTRHWPHAWREILARWTHPYRPEALAGSDPWRWLRLRMAAPDQRWMLGIEQRRAQPCLVFKDGTSIAMY